MKRSAVAVAVASPEKPAAGQGAVDALRRTLAQGTAREHVVLDFLEDDLREARSALAAVAAYLVNVEGALARGSASRQQLLSLAVSGMPRDRIEELSGAVASVRRRIAQVASRM